MTNRFLDKRVFVTGAGTGIGFEIARQFAEEGSVVGLNSRSTENSQTAVERITSSVSGSRVFAYPCDIADIAAIQSHVDSFAENHDGLDVFIANAGITAFAPFLEIQPEEFENLLAVNLQGTFFSVQAAARQMSKRNTGGRIVLMSSVCGIQSHLNTSAYGATKAAIRHLAISLAEELGPHGITVNCVAPGATVNERTAADAEYVDGWSSVTPTKTVGTVADVAYSTLFLADERASHISGEVLMVDGGWTTTSPLPAHLKEQLRKEELEREVTSRPVVGAK